MEHTYLVKYRVNPYDVNEWFNDSYWRDKEAVERYAEEIKQYYHYLEVAIVEISEDEM